MIILKIKATKQTLYKTNQVYLLNENFQFQQIENKENFNKLKEN